jgi:hypothetical protein
LLRIDEADPGPSDDARHGSQTAETSSLPQRWLSDLDRKSRQERLVIFFRRRFSKQLASAGFLAEIRLEPDLGRQPDSGGPGRRRRG